MPESKIGKTGNAPIKKQGQTSQGTYGDDPDSRSHYGNKGSGDTPRELKGK